MVHMTVLLTPIWSDVNVKNAINGNVKNYNLRLMIKNERKFGD